MSNNGNNGTGFWVIVALIAVMSVVALVEAATRFLLASGRKLLNAASNRQSNATIRGC